MAPTMLKKVSQDLNSVTATIQSLWESNAL